MKFIWTGKKWVNGDKIRSIEVYEYDEEIKENWKCDVKKMGYKITKDLLTGKEYCRVGKIEIEMDGGNIEPVFSWQKPDEATETARIIVQMLEGVYSEKCEEEKNPHEEARIEGLELSTGIFNILRRRGILKVGDILEIIREGKLKEIRGIGQTKEQEILEKVHLFMEART